MQVRADIDSGNITVIQLENADDIQLNIRPDNQSDYFQWFNFHFSAESKKNYTFSLFSALPI